MTKTASCRVGNVLLWLITWWAIEEQVDISITLVVVSIINGDTWLCKSFSLWRSHVQYFFYFMLFFWGGAINRIKRLWRDFHGNVLDLLHTLFLNWELEGFLSYSLSTRFMFHNFNSYLNVFINLFISIKELVYTFLAGSCWL